MFILFVCVHVYICALTALWDEAAAHIGPGEELRDRPESMSYREQKNPKNVLLESK